LAQLLAWLAQRQKVLSGVVFSGGEATLQVGLPEALQAVKAMGFATKLDTNGLQPNVLTALLAEGLLDYVALDVKAPPKKYATVVGLPAEASAGVAAKVEASMMALKASGIAFECRTTVASPLLSDEDVMAIGHWVAGVPRYVLQAFRPVTSPLALAGAETLLPPAEGQLQRLQAQLAPLVGGCLVR
jgi:pyruvate formate lyase activating enzyme